MSSISSRLNLINPTGWTSLGFIAVTEQLSLVRRRMQSDVETKRECKLESWITQLVKYK